MDDNFAGQQSLGRLTMSLLLAESPARREQILAEARRYGYLHVTGHVGSMQVEKVVAAVETASRRSGLIDQDHYRASHALYHAILEALQGVFRGPMALGGVLRTVGLSFAVLRGSRAPGSAADGEWLAVGLYGTIGAPIRGFEHEVMGLGMNHL